MTVREAATEWGLSKSYVVKLCANGMVGGAQLVKCRSGFRYEIPEGAKRPVIKKIRRVDLEQTSQRAACQDRKMPKIAGRSPARYIWDCQSRYTIGELAAKLGITCSKVVQLYDRSFRTFQETGGSMR